MKTLEWLSQLVAIDTTSRNSNLQIIDTIQNWVTDHGMVTRLTYDDKEKKANLFATLPAANGSTEGGIILSGHTDVVPVDGQQWETNPFVATVKDDKVFGRGTCDMKGFLAVALALLPEFKLMKLKHPVHFAFSYDEEVGCRGAPLLIADLQAAGIKPTACIVGEPSNMQPVIAHKGIQVFRCRVHGHAVHSSLTPKGCNAIEYAAKLICYIRELADEIRKAGPFDDYYDVPYTSVTTNMIQGGIAHNTIPALCEFIFEFRHLPQVKPNTIIDKITQYVTSQMLPNMHKEQAHTKVEIDNIAVAPGFEADIDGALNQLAQQLTQEKTIRKVAYATEAGLFQHAEIPTLVCGPGSIEQAHRPNEFVALEQLQKCELFLRNVVQ